MIEPLLTSPEFWLIVGLVLIILDLVIGLQFFVLSFGVGALITATLAWASSPTPLVGFLPMDDWVEVVVVFGVSSLCTLAPIRAFMYKKYDSQKDINDY